MGRSACEAWTECKGGSLAVPIWGQDLCSFVLSLAVHDTVHVTIHDTAVWGSRVHAWPTESLGAKEPNRPSWLQGAPAEPLGRASFGVSCCVLAAWGHSQGRNVARAPPLPGEHGWASEADSAL